MLETNHMTTTQNNYPKPPQTCKLRVYLTNHDGVEFNCDDCLQWNGLIRIRWSDNLDDEIELHTENASVWVQIGDVEWLGQPKELLPTKIWTGHRCANKSTTE